ncbi:MAG: hypothetical protein IKB30_01595 [Clostridia bacterium]|nr:hypothetical protein [Clostridia bacterium]
MKISEKSLSVIVGILCIFTFICMFLPAFAEKTYTGLTVYFGKEASAYSSNNIDGAVLSGIGYIVMAICGVLWIFCYEKLIQPTQKILIGVMIASIILISLTGMFFADVNENYSNAMSYALGDGIKIALLLGIIAVILACILVFSEKNEKKFIEDLFKDENKEQKDLSN